MDYFLHIRPMIEYGYIRYKDGGGFCSTPLSVRFKGYTGTVLNESGRRVSFSCNLDESLPT